MLTFKEYLAEAYKDMGKLSDEELKKGQKLKGDKDDFKKVTSRVFKQAIEQITKNDIAKGDNAKGLETLTIHSLKEYDQMDCYLGKNNSSGYCIGKKDGELVSVFSTQGSSARSLMTSAVDNGAKHLDCFAIRDPKTGKISGDLYSLYSKFGFKIDTSMNGGEEPYIVVKGVSDFVDDNGVRHPEDPRVVIFMKR